MRIETIIRKGKEFAVIPRWQTCRSCWTMWKKPTS